MVGDYRFSPSDKTESVPGIGADSTCAGLHGPVMLESSIIWVLPALTAPYIASGKRIADNRGAPVPEPASYARGPRSQNSTTQSS